MSLDRWLHDPRARSRDGVHVTLDVRPNEWRELFQAVVDAGGRLLSLSGTNDRVSRAIHAVVAVLPRVLLARMRLANEAEPYPGIEDIYPNAGRMQRAIRDLTGLRSTATDARPWLRHAAWADDVHPLRDATMPMPVSEPLDEYPFVRVEGDGVHEIAVGPVHAGIIEPGHFRFSVVGEKVLRLEQHLGYVHKGIERRFTEMPLLDAHRLAARISGDSAVAYSLAYVQAVERMAQTLVPARAVWLRALALELERIANHLGDLGALGNDAGFAFGLMQFLQLKERLLRTLDQAFGQRYLFDFVVPGGTHSDLSDPSAARLADCMDHLTDEVQVLRDIYEEHSGLRDRFSGAGTLAPDLARWLGVVGLAGRASGQPLDLRLDLDQAPYGDLGLHRCVQQDGDVLARVTVRFDELAESLRIVQDLLGELPDGSHRGPCGVPPEGSAAVGLVEGWRGPVVVEIEAGPQGGVRRCHPQDPSWHNWPALEHAIIGNIVPDFPLINKSFNLSYSGHDL